MASVPGETPDSVPYRLSSPNEHDVDDSSRVLPAITRPYLVSPPNEHNPQALLEGELAATQPYPYRLSPPNETDPTGP